MRERVSISEDESERRALLEKEWNRYCGVRHKEEIQQFDRVIQSRKVSSSNCKLFLAIHKNYPKLSYVGHSSATKSLAKSSQLF